MSGGGGDNGRMIDETSDSDIDNIINFPIFLKRKAQNIIYSNSLGSTTIFFLHFKLQYHCYSNVMQ